MKVVGIIPARYESKRFPGKPLIKILGKSMIQRVYEQCAKCKNLTEIIVATDDERILNHVLKFGGKAVITSRIHETGTERCNEVAKTLNFNYDIIVNIQGDEPFINPLQIDEIINLFDDEKTQIGTLAKEINEAEILSDENSPKVIIDKNGNALNFCRKISSFSDQLTYYKHVGIYAYKKDILLKVSELPQSKNEIQEQLEQLRWLDNKYTITVGVTCFQSISVDTPKDLERIKEQMR